VVGGEGGVTSADEGESDELVGRAEQGSGFSVSGFRLRVSDFGFRVSGFRLRVSDFGF